MSTSSETLTRKGIPWTCWRHSYFADTNLNLTFSRSCELEETVTSKSILKICNLTCLNLPVRVKKLLHFPFSLAVSGIVAILNKCSKFDLSWALSEAWIDTKSRIKIDVLIIVISKISWNFTKFYEMLCVIFWVIVLISGVWRHSPKMCQIYMNIENNQITTVL